MKKKRNLKNSKVTIMSTLVKKEYRYTDIQRVLEDKYVFLLTILGSGLAFVFSYFPQTYIVLDFLPAEYRPPFNFTLTVTTIIVFSMLSKNLGATILIALVGALGIQPYQGTTVAFGTLYLLTLLLTITYLTYLYSRKYLIGEWATRLFLLALVLIGIILTYTHYVRAANPALYWNLGYDIGIGGSGEFVDGDYPVIDAIYFIVALAIMLYGWKKFRSELNLTKKGAKNYRLIGASLILVGQLITIVPFIIYNAVLPENDMLKIASTKNIEPLQDLFLKSDLFSVLLNPVSPFDLAVLTIAFTYIGILFVLTGMKEGTLAVTRGCIGYTFFFAPIATAIFLVFGTYIVQNFIAPGGYYISDTMLVVYFTVLWTFFTISDLIAWVVLFFAQLFKK